MILRHYVTQTRTLHEVQGEPNNKESSVQAKKYSIQASQHSG